MKKDEFNEIYEGLSEEAMVTSMILAISYTPIALDDIRDTWQSYEKLRKSDPLEETFEKCTAELEKALIRIYRDEENGNRMVEFTDPAIAEMICAYIGEHEKEYAVRLCDSSIFYNQLLALLDKVHCREKISRKRLEKRCVEEFYTLPMRLCDYNAPELGETDRTLGNWCSRMSSLLLAADPKIYPQIRKFAGIFVARYFEELEENDLYDAEDDLVKFIEMIAVMKERGIAFDPEWAMWHYLDYCKHAYEFDRFADFQKLYPKNFRYVRFAYARLLKENLRNMIVSDLKAYQDSGDTENFNKLLDDAINMLHRHSFNYTKKFKHALRDAIGFYPQN